MKRHLDIGSGAFFGFTIGLISFVILSLVGIGRAVSFDAALWTAVGYAASFSGTCFYLSLR